MKPATERQVPDNREDQQQRAQAPQVHRPEVEAERPSARGAYHPYGPQHGEAQVSGDGEGVVLERGQEVAVDGRVGAAQTAAAGAVDAGEAVQRADRVVARVVRVDGPDVGEGPGDGR